MCSAEALVTALSMVDYPHVTRRVREAPLPKGMTFLLQVAAGDEEAISKAEALTGQTERRLRKAAGFFVEQVLLSQLGDHYRVLGCDRDASNAELRRHMALIMKWLHPDRIAGGASTSGFDKSLYANHVTEAWEALKTEDRRAAYDASLDGDQRMRKAANAKSAGRSLVVVLQPNGASGAKTNRLMMPYRVPVRPIGFWSRLFSMFAGR